MAEYKISIKKRIIAIGVMLILFNIVAIYSGGGFIIIISSYFLTGAYCGYCYDKYQYYLFYPTLFAMIPVTLLFMFGAGMATNAGLTLSDVFGAISVSTIITIFLFSCVSIGIFFGKRRRNDNSGGD